MQTAPDKTQPALYAGLAIGVLSGLPLVNLGNCLCCLWVVGGGALAVYLMQQNYPYSVQAADGALVGLLAGLIGGALCGLIAIPIALAMGPFQQRIMERVINSNPDFPPEMRTMIENMARGGAFGVFAIVGIFVRAVVFGIIAMLGGLLGVALFKKKDLPPPGTTEILPPA
jgi:hypothetical protein